MQYTSLPEAIDSYDEFRLSCYEDIFYCVDEVAGGILEQCNKSTVTRKLLRYRTNQYDGDYANSAGSKQRKRQLNGVVQEQEDFIILKMKEIFYKISSFHGYRLIYVVGVWFRKVLSMEIRIWLRLTRRENRKSTPSPSSSPLTFFLLPYTPLLHTTLLEPLFP